MAKQKTSAPASAWIRGTLRIALEVGLPCLSAWDGHAWVQLPILSLVQGLRFCRALGVDVPVDCRARIAAGQIVTLVEAKGRE
jgi:hypothetical protein